MTNNIINIHKYKHLTSEPKKKQVTAIKIPLTVGASNEFEPIKTTELSTEAEKAYFSK